MARKAVHALIITIAFLLCACQAGEIDQGNEVSVSPTVPTATAKIPPEQEVIWEAWEGSVHADTYAPEKGPNTYCAKCHSPKNWDYAAKIDPPPNCVSCKFPFEPETRVAVNNPLVPEEEWAHIGCAVCHRVDGRLANPQIAWYDNSTGYYETIGTSTDLCEKCHRDKDSSLYHRRDLGEDAHLGFTCTNCHDPHDPIASCGSTGCHTEIVDFRRFPAEEHVSLSQKEQCLDCHEQGMENHDMETQRSGETDCLVCHEYLANLKPEDLPAVQHASIHATVNCVACHDVSGLEVQPVEGQSEWMPFRTLDLQFGASSDPYQSHNLGKAVDCGKCHHPDNPWELPEPVISAQ